MAQAWHCSKCGGTNTQVSATARWDVDKQEWVLEDVDDSPYGDYCDDCAEYQFGEFRDVTDLKTAALVAINQNTTSSEDQHDNSNALAS